MLDLLRSIARAMQLVYTIQGGDFIHVSQARMAFAVGLVKKPGKVPVKENLTVSQALAHVEELDPLLALNNGAILRLAGC